MAGKLASQITRLPRIWRAAHYCQEYLNHYNYFSYDHRINGEKYLLDKISSLKPKVVFDVGCNVGSWTGTAIKPLRSAKFHCFDIAEDSLNQAKSNLANFSNIAYNLAAISDIDGSIQYRDYGSKSPLNTTLLESCWTEPGNLGSISNITSIKGDTYCEINQITYIDLLKLDCEGADHRALKGFTAMLKDRRIRIIQFEYGYTNGDAKFLMRDFFEFFSTFGYILAPLRPHRLLFEDWRYDFNNFNSGPNWIAIQKDDFELNNLLR